MSLSEAEKMIAHGCLSVGEARAACRRANGAALVAYQQAMDGTHTGEVPATSGRTMPARALNRGPQKIGLFTL
jgi:hypothetical protein